MMALNTMDQEPWGHTRDSAILQRLHSIKNKTKTQPEKGPIWFNAETNDQWFSRKKKMNQKQMIGIKQFNAHCRCREHTLSKEQKMRKTMGSKRANALTPDPFK